jgi:hypothetical protein
MASTGLKLAKVSYDATYSLKRSQEAILVLLRNGLCRKGCARPAKRLLCSSCTYWVWPFSLVVKGAFTAQSLQLAAYSSLAL